MMRSNGAPPRWRARVRRQRGRPIPATGLIVGESLWGVLFAGIVAGSGRDAPLALVGEDFEPFALASGTALFVLLALWLYRRTMKLAS